MPSIAKCLPCEGDPSLTIQDDEALPKVVLLPGVPNLLFTTPITTERASLFSSLLQKSIKNQADIINLVYMFK